MSAPNRYLLATSAADALAGDTGFDTASYENADGPVTVNLGNPSLNAGWATGDRYHWIEAIVGSRFGDSLIGDNNRNVLNGIAGDDFLFGLGGDDVLIGGTGADRLNGGQGYDIASYETAQARVVVNLINAAVNEGDAAGDSFVSIEGIVGGRFNDDLTGDGASNVILGGAGADFIYGLGGDDSLLGEDGNDRLFGGAGSDVLDGGAGDDMIIGGQGPDTIIGGTGFDTLTYESSNGPVTVNLGNNALNGGAAAGDTISGIDNLIGSLFGDSLIGDNNRNVLNGVAGNDFIFGLGGDDVLIGGAGRDTLNGGAGFDLASYETSARVVVNLTRPSVNTGDAAGDSYVSIEGVVGGRGNDDLTGNGGNNLLLGGEGLDFLYGLGGHDTLGGGRGNDTLFGGLGSDIFVFAAGDLNASTDVIKDFQISPASDNDVIRFEGIAASQLSFQQVGANAIIQIHVNGADSFIRVENFNVANLAHQLIFT